MKTYRKVGLTLGLWTIGLLAAWSDPALESRMPQIGELGNPPADCVDVFTGTSNSRWMIAPGPWMPFSMVKISPDNQPQGWNCGYDYSRNHIDCFSHIHEWTMGGLGRDANPGAACHVSRDILRA